MTTTAPAARTALHTTPELGPLGRLADLTYRHRLATVLAWVGALALAVGLSVTVGGTFTADYSAPGADSTVARTLLAEKFPALSGDTVDIVVTSERSVTSPAVQSRVADMLGRLGAVPHVANVQDPYATASTGSISTDGRTLVTRARLDVLNAPDMPKSDSLAMIKVAKASSVDGVQVFLGGESISGNVCTR